MMFGKKNQNDKINGGADPADEMKASKDGDSEPGEEAQAQKEAAQKENGAKQERTRHLFWGLAGVYLVYSAYTMFKEIRTEGGAWYFWIFIVLFFAAGIFLIWQMLKGYLIKPKDSGDAGMPSDPAQQEKDAAGEAPAETVPQPSPETEPQKIPGITLKAVILAEQKASLGEEDLPQALLEINDLPMALYVKEGVFQAGAQAVCYAIGYQHDRARIALADRGVTFAVAGEGEESDADALFSARNFIGTSGDVFVLYSDTPLITADTYERLLERHRADENAASVLSALEGEDGIFSEYAVGYLFGCADLYAALEHTETKQGKCGLPEILSVLKDEGKNVRAYCIGDEARLLHIDTEAKRRYAASELRERM